MTSEFLTLGKTAKFIQREAMRAAPTRAIRERIQRTSAEFVEALAEAAKHEFLGRVK
jgi:hypothetical protein